MTRRGYLLRHLSGHHGPRRHLTRSHPRGWHHARRGHIRWLTRHVHHTRGLAHGGHSLRSGGHHKPPRPPDLNATVPTAPTYSHTAGDNHAPLRILLAPRGVGGLHLLLLLLAVSLHVSPLHLGDDVRVLLGILDTLKEEKPGIRSIRSPPPSQKRQVVRPDGGRGSYHGLVVERKPLHGPQGVGGAVDLFEYHKGLALHLQGPCDQDVQDLSKL